MKGECNAIESCAQEHQEATEGRAAQAGEEDARSAQGLVERLVGLNVMYSTSVADEISLLYSTSVADEISLLRLVKQRGAYSIPNFNDREGTTRKDVLAVVDERIAQLEAGK